jgi:hypothetical protein
VTNFTPASVSNLLTVKTNVTCEQTAHREQFSYKASQPEKLAHGTSETYLIVIQFVKNPDILDILVTMIFLADSE